MNILTTNRKGGPYESIKEFLRKSLVNSEYELEWIYGSHPRNSLKKEEFLRVLNFCRQNYKFSGESSVLDIRSQYVRLDKSGLSSIRCSISGVQNIKKYCKTNSIVDIPTCTFMKKVSNKDDKNPSLSFNQIVNTDYNFRINLKKEILLNDDDSDLIKFKDELKESLKYYRYKKRFSFKTNDNLYRIDITAVKSNSYNPKRKTYNLAKNLVDSRILTGKEVYELEIEYIGNIKINGEYPIVDFSKRVFSDWSKQTMSDEDYEAQIALITKVDESMGFSPEGSNHYLGDLNDGYGFLSEYESIVSEEPIQGEDVVEPINTMNTPWAKAAALKGDPMNLIYMTHWHYDKNWFLFWLIKENDKEVLFDGVQENYTADYEGAPLNTNYIKYVIYPPVSEEDNIKIEEYNEIYKKRLSEGFDGVFYVPFEFIYGLEGIKDELKASAKKLPSWAPKQENSLTKDKRFIECVEFKLNELIGLLLSEIQCNKLLVSNRKCESILKDYKNLTEQNSEFVKFLGPQPVSMGLEMLNPDNPHNILKGYVVTEKADGIRAELYIDLDSDGYLITQKKEIIYTGLKFNNYKNTILDGEYITKDRDGKDIKLFMIFDIYYMDGGDYASHPYTYPWLNKKDLPSRSIILNDFQNKVHIHPSIIRDIRDGIYNLRWSKDDKEIRMKDTIRIGYKRYYEGPKKLITDKVNPSLYKNLGGIGKYCKKILDLDKKDNYEYNIDGLIFMPMNYSVSSDSESVVVDNIGITWYHNYKWKPPEENTIDFRIEFVKEENNKNKITSFTRHNKVIKCQQVKLYVGYDISKDITTDFTWKVMGYHNKKQNEILFNPPTEKDSIHLCNIPLTDDKLICKKDKTILQDRGIYEMRYEPNNPFGYQWMPLRVRDDKTRPNASSTADNVWKTIQYPVLEKYITGKDLTEIDYTVEKEKSDYYIEDVESDADISLREFHNYIKDKLIRSITSLGNKNISILDTSIGRGGDLNKYLRSENKIDFLLGLDISGDINKCAKRYYLKNEKTKALFLQYDTSKSIKGGEGCVGDHIERNKLLIDILYDRQRALPKELRPLVPKYKGLCKKGFDIISSQFSIHYYFKDELTLRTYIQNISENIKKGGYFIGTCYDGMKVFQMLDKTGGHIEMMDEFNNKVYSITKNYDLDDFNYSKDNIEKLFGQKIDVYMNSIGQTITEYLVNFELFIETMKEYDLVLAKPDVKKDFKGFFDNKDLSYTDGLGGFEKMIDNLEALYSKDLSIKQYFPESFGLLKQKNKLLRDLSSLNNWFIFQKI